MPAEMHLVIGPERRFVDQLRDAALHHQGGRTRIAVAWAREDGVLWLLNALEDKISDLKLVVGVNERGTSVEALLRLLSGASELWVFYKHPTQTFHPKLYAFEAGHSGDDALTVLVGSSNVTTGGLLSNFEAALHFEARTSSDVGAQLLQSLNHTWSAFTTGPFAHKITAPDEIERLYRTGRVITETTMRRERRRTPKTEAPDGEWPTAPPPFQKTPKAEEVTIPFALDKEPPTEEAPPESTDPKGVAPLPYRFFVRTLTANDVAKLHDQQEGTFEPDLGRLARDRYPAFWGWPDKYKPVKRRLERDEWPARARLISRVTGSAGVEIELMLWYREPRPRHAEEHRFRPGPIGAVREAVPPDFDTSSIVVFERSPDDAEYDFTITFLTPADAGYSDYVSYLTEQRPEHRFGYGPAPGI